MNELELFEAYMKKEHPFIDTVNGAYEAMWNLWQARVPEGYVVVPVEPTKAMQQSAFDVYEVCDYKNYHLNSGTEVRDMIYKAMIEAVEK